MENYLIVIIRTILGYVLFFLLMKFMGKREIGQISLFDFIIILSIADLMVMGIDNFNRDILFSFLPMIIVAIIQKILAVISLKSSKIRNMLDGDISYIIVDGMINLEEMKKQRYNMNDLYTQLREIGVKSIQEVDTAILESSGKLSVFKSNKESYYSLPVITSGEIDEKVLLIEHKDINWINKELNKQHVNLKDVLGASIIDGKLDIVKIINLSNKKL